MGKAIFSRRNAVRRQQFDILGKKFGVRIGCLSVQRWTVLPPLGVKKNFSFFSSLLFPRESDPNTFPGKKCDKVCETDHLIEHLRIYTVFLQHISLYSKPRKKQDLFSASLAQTFFSAAIFLWGKAVCLQEENIDFPQR